MRGLRTQSRQSVRNLKNKLNTSTLEAKLIPTKVVVIEKKWYDDLMKWINDQSPVQPKELNNRHLSLCIKTNKEIKRGVDYEIVNEDTFLDLSKSFSINPNQKIEGSLTINPTTKEETVLFKPVSIHINLPSITRSSSRSISRPSRIYDLDPNWNLGDFRKLLCEKHNIEPSSSSFYLKQNSISKKLDDKSSIKDIKRISRDIIELDLKNDNASTTKTVQKGITRIVGPKGRNPSVPRFKRQVDSNAEIKQTVAKTVSNTNQIAMKTFASSSRNVQDQTEKDQYESFSSSMNTNSQKLIEKDTFGMSNHLKSQPQSVFNASSKSIFQNKESTPKKSEISQKVSTFAEPASMIGSISTKHFPKPVGFCNLGNTCFFNAALQCLVRVQPLTDFILSSEFDKQLNIRNPKSSNGRIANAYRAFLEDLCKCRSGYKDPSNLRSAFVSKFKRFANFGQHDSQELLCCLLDGIHEDLNQSSFAKGRNPPIQTDSNSDYWDVHLSKNASPVVDIFHGKLFSSITCPSCHRVESVHDPFMFLQLDIPRRFSAVKLADCLASFSERYTLDANNKWKCSGCNQMVCATKEMGVDSCPQILMIHLKRFSGEGYFASKVDTKVDYPDELDSKTFSRKNSGIYRLIGAVFHSGGLGGGHYTAAALDPETKEWYNFNDSIASPISSSGAHKGGAYILFYQRI